jgi:hypothetical protein
MAVKLLVHATMPDKDEPETEIQRELNDLRERPSQTVLEEDPRYVGGRSLGTRASV